MPKPKTDPEMAQFQADLLLSVREFKAGSVARTMVYKGYSARVEYSEEDGCFVGRIAGIRAIVGFHADTFDALEVAFHEAVHDYLALVAHT